MKTKRYVQDHSTTKSSDGLGVQWHIEDNEDGLVVIKNVRYEKYVAFAGSLRPGAPAIAVPHKREWDLLREGDSGLFRYTMTYIHLNHHTNGTKDHCSRLGEL